jgi:hypothetical protein
MRVEDLFWGGPLVLTLLERRRGAGGLSPSTLLRRLLPWFALSTCQELARTQCTWTRSREERPREQGTRAPSWRPV